jgi:hypothetical protein
MKSLKYLNLNFKPYWCGCECGLYTRSDYVYLDFDELARREKSISNLETIIIGSKLF